MLRVAFALIAVCVCLTVVAAQQPTKPAVTMDDIKKVWQERQDKVKTLKMTWKRTSVVPKGSLEFARRYFAASGADLPSPQPPKDLRCSGEASLVLSGDRFRYECRADSWSVTTQSLKQTRSIAILDADAYKTSNTNEHDSAHDIFAIESVERSSFQFEMVELKPVWWCTRGTRNALGKNSLEDFEVTGRSINLAGTPCLELEKNSRSTDTSIRLIVSHSEFLPMRYTIASRNRVVLQLDLEYDEQSTASYIPKLWRYAHNEKKGITGESVEVRVTNCEVGGDISDEAFRVPTKSGTVLTDLRKNQIAMILPDGSTSRSVPKESVQTYEELVTATSPRFNRWWWLAGALASLAAIAVTYFVVKRPRKGAIG